MTKMKQLLIKASRWLRHLPHNTILALRIWRAEREAGRRLAAMRERYPGCEGAMNTWPPINGVTTGYAVDGISTIRWGTEGLLQSPAPASGYYTVLSFDQKELVDVIKLPQGVGLTSGRVRIKDGGHWAITVRDDTTMTPPIVGTLMQFVDAAGIKGTVGLRYFCTVVENDYKTAIKQAGERVLIAENLLLIESQSGAAQI
jgi:hypothetical protein